MIAPNDDSKPHVVIVGGGFAGLETARRLRKAALRVTLIDRHNYHLFQPLLYQVATGALSPANIAAPLRSILRRQSNCEVVLGEVTDFNIADKRVVLAVGDTVGNESGVTEIPFDFLIVAAGATHTYFGNDHWEPNAPGLKSIQDATEIRRRIYSAFEAAEWETDPEVRAELMTFVIVGGGPTGVELAGALSEIARDTLKQDFRHIDPKDARILIVEAAEHVLAHYPDALCRKAADKIRSRGIEVHTQTKVTDIRSNHVRLIRDTEETVVPTRTVLWAAGVKANALGPKIASDCGIETDRAGRVPVGPTLHVEGHDHIFVIGDLASCADAEGRQLPGVAPVAIQQGRHVARQIINRVAGGPAPKTFRYKDPGTMATIGRSAAVALVGKRQFCGLFAWILWLIVHLMQIVQFQNRILVLMQWAWNYITFNRSARLITGDEPLSEPVAKPDKAL